MPCPLTRNRLRRVGSQRLDKGSLGIKLTHCSKFKSPAGENGHSGTGCPKKQRFQKVLLLQRLERCIQSNAQVVHSAVKGLWGKLLPKAFAGLARAGESAMT